LKQFDLPGWIAGTCAWSGKQKYCVGGSVKKDLLFGPGYRGDVCLVRYCFNNLFARIVQFAAGQQQFKPHLSRKSDNADGAQHDY